MFFISVYLLLTLGINRNIVECKSESVLEKIDTSTGINRNIVECKLIRNMERHKVEEMN